jgi:hypothetical protein
MPDKKTSMNRQSEVLVLAALIQKAATFGCFYRLGKNTGCMEGKGI